MWIAAISWDSLGYEVVCTRADGRTLPPWRIGAGDAHGLVTRLRDLEAEHGCEVVAVVESTNGMLDGPLLAAGVTVFRADPWHLPQRPGGASVSAELLAHHAAPALNQLVRLTTETGTLAGRIEELQKNIEAAGDVERELTQRGLCLERGETTEPRVSLTFDDGPHPPYTDGILDVLRDFGVPATFFCVGLNADAHPVTLERIASEGHVIGNHTWSHPYLPDLTRNELDFQIDATNRAVRRVTGADPWLLRPPYGSRTPDVLRWLADREMTTVLWDNDPCDWAMPGADSITEAAVRQTEHGSIVLMHDGGGDRSQTVQALPGIIRRLVEDGYRFVSLDEISTPL
ncbi:polysaccharide deacetylase family protein [Streptomyces sp. MW-W600-10]|uniref:polysaccharide deacetylase family protein n=1 Tax=Streptomyces sp. MW-W600-10 TaxID=2829819 RepID=UPI001C495D75|nr:polysaccharide deacetylase family protein [Streptomyces sp. MW-W600-10]MBV7245821.1 polysaccharide deacetylase family protein [Streptomyces sp. MW-W600-10]